jgi:hypothetical protein
MDIDKITENIKILLKIQDTKVYDDQLNLAILGAIEEFQTNGIPQQEETSKLFNMYCEAIFYKVAPQMKEQFNIGDLYISNYNNIKKNLQVELENESIS